MVQDQFLVEVAKSALPMRGPKGLSQNDLLAITSRVIDKHLAEGEPPSFRLARQSAIEVLIDEVVGWE
mgnify:FL=1